MEKQITIEESSDSLVLVPVSFLKKILLNQEKILELLSSEKGSKGDLGDFITEKDASKMIGRKTTWFWNLRKTGHIPYTKVGSKIFYER